MLNISKDEKRYSEIELDLHKKLAYEKGRASIIEELEKIKAEMAIKTQENLDAYKDCLEIVRNHISELKGENND